MTYDPKDMTVGDVIRVNGQQQIVDSVPSIDGGPFAAHYYGRDGGEIRGIVWAGDIDQSVDPTHQSATIELISKGDGTLPPPALLPGEPAPLLDAPVDPAAAAERAEFEAWKAQKAAEALITELAEPVAEEKAEPEEPAEDDEPEPSITEDVPAEPPVLDLPTEEHTE